jgi:hypothetical protein
MTDEFKKPRKAHVLESQTSSCSFVVSVSTSDFA